MRVSKPRTPVYLESDLELVIASDPYSTLDIQRARLEGTTEFPASYAYLLPPMRFVDGNFARGRLRFETNTERERLVVPSRQLPEIRGAAFVSSPFGNKFFGHYISDDLPTAVLGAEFGAPHFVCPLPSPYEQEEEYRRILGLEHPRVWSGRAVDSWVFSDPYLNDSKVERIHALRSQIADVTRLRAGSSRRLYLTRGSAAAGRSAENEGELERLLEAEGWDIVDPASTPVSSLHEAIFSADIVAGVEGSQMYHALYGLREGRAILLLMPPERFNLILKDFTDRLGLRLGFHVGLKTLSGWRIDVPAMQRVLAQLDSEAPRG